MIYKSSSNLALIKYMGKKDSKKNIPCNASLSYTLDHLISAVKILPQIKGIPSDSWKPLAVPSWPSLKLNRSEKERYLLFFAQLKKKFSIDGFYCIQSTNNFQKSAGLASSASSFAALTLASYQLALRTSMRKEKIQSLSIKQVAQISQEGSGSSCRSFFKPWCLWEEENIQKIYFPFKPLLYDLVILDKNEKEVSSSSAHKRVLTSPYFRRRPQRAHSRLIKLISALRKKDWLESYVVVKEEFEDMHHLFETSVPSFSYRTTKTFLIINEIEKQWKDNKDGPMITMDAGNQIHLLYRSDQDKLKEKVKRKLASLL